MSRGRSGIEAEKRIVRRRGSDVESSSGLWFGDRKVGVVIFLSIELLVDRGVHKMTNVCARVGYLQGSNVSCRSRSRCR